MLLANTKGFDQTAHTCILILLQLLTDCYLKTSKRVIGKQCRPRSIYVFVKIED